MSTKKSVSTLPPLSFGKLGFLVVVQQRDVNFPRRYRGWFNREPTLDELKAMGVDYHAPRHDKIEVIAVSEALMSATWEFKGLRPD